MSRTKTNKSIWSNYLIDYGYFPISNLLIDKQDELGLKDSEILFIIKISRYSDGFTIKDKNISGRSSRSLQRDRDSLREKGLLETRDFRTKDRKTGKFINSGIIYDFSKLDQRLSEIYATYKAEKVLDNEDTFLLDDNDLNKASKEVRELAGIFKDAYSRFQETCPDALRAEVDKRWISAKTYTVLKTDVKQLKTLTKDEIKDLKLGFKYFDRYLISEIEYGTWTYKGEGLIPRISLFIASAFQYERLMNFAKDCEYEV